MRMDKRLKHKYKRAAFDDDDSPILDKYTIEMRGICLTRTQSYQDLARLAQPMASAAAN